MAIKIKSGWHCLCNFRSVRAADLLLCMFSGAACVAVAWLIANFFWWFAFFFVGGGQSLAPSALPSLVEEVARIQRNRLFGTAESSVSGAPGAPAVVVVQAEWSVLGTYVRPGGMGFAVLSSAGDPESKVVQVGDKLPTGHQVLEVTPYAVTLTLNGQKSVISLRAESGERKDSQAVVPDLSNGGDAPVISTKGLP